VSCQPESRLGDVRAVWGVILVIPTGAALTR
jgi:hypothetical protein